MQDFLRVDSEQSAAGFKTKTTVGVMLASGVIDNMVVGGPAYNSRQLDKGDLVVEIDGKQVANENLSQLLVGSDVAGTPVTIGVRKGGKNGTKKSVTLLRMPSEAIADRRRLFELFTAMKARATLPRGRETIEGMIDNAIELWTRMAIADSEREAKVRTQVTQVQENTKKHVAEIMRLYGTKKDLFFKRHDDALGLKEHFDSLDGSLQSAQVESARLTLALKEAEGEAMELQTENEKMRQELAEAREAMESMRKAAADTASELSELKGKGVGDSEVIAKLKKELSIEEGNVKELMNEKNELLAQVDRLNRAIADSKEQVSKGATMIGRKEIAHLLTTPEALWSATYQISADLWGIAAPEGPCRCRDGRECEQQEACGSKDCHIGIAGRLHVSHLRAGSCSE